MTAPRKPPRAPRPEPEGFTPAQPEAPAPPRRSRAAPATAPSPPAILSDLLRGPLQMVGQVTGLDSAARSMERLAASAERAAELLDRLDREVGIDRVISVLERLERLSETADQMNRSLRAVEKLAMDVQKRVVEPLDRLPLPRALRGMSGSRKDKP
ncbi:MAG: hypothetical protein NVSMB17_17890 [Candidatus Dormibacteria bacterium]